MAEVTERVLGDNACAEGAAHCCIERTHARAQPTTDITQELFENVRGR